jgi:hypothetical protein
VIVRVLLGVGLFALGYYLGREAGRGEPLRDALAPSDETAAGEGAGGEEGPEGQASGRETLQ